jgi:hypothetical protein
MNNKKTPKEKPEAIDRFVVHVQKSMINCKHILSHIEEHCGISPENITWADVGTAEHVNELLQEICDFIGIKKEN